MDVLLSIKPEYAMRIFNGNKKFEYRKIRFKHAKLSKVIVYVSSPVQRIVGEFEIGDILQDNPISLWEKTSAYSGIDRTAFFEYFSGKNEAYAITIENVKKYVSPINPYDIFSSFIPPQSFMYIDMDTLRSEESPIIPLLKPSFIFQPFNN